MIAHVEINTIQDGLYLILIPFIHPSQFSNISLNVSLLQDSISTWIFHLPFPPLPFSFPFALSHDLKYHLHSYNFWFKSPTSCLNSGFIYPTAHLTSLGYQQTSQILHIWTQRLISSPRLVPSCFNPIPPVTLVKMFSFLCTLSLIHNETLPSALSNKSQIQPFLNPNCYPST